MQVNLHGSPCISDAVLHCFDYRKKISTESTKMRHFDPKISTKNCGEEGLLFPRPLPCGKGDTPSPHPIPVGSFGARHWLPNFNSCILFFFVQC